MPKLRTRKTLSKRIRVTSKGRIFRKKISASHLRVKLSSSRKFRKGRDKEIGITNIKQIKQMLPKVR